jgi:hypothetical protein
VPAQQIDSASRDERYGKVGLLGSVDQGLEMGQKRIEFASHKKARGGLGTGCFVDDKFGRLFGKVVRQLGDHVPNTTTGVRDIAVVARDQMDVQVADGLASGGTDVDPDVVAVGLVAMFDVGFGDFQGCREGLLLLCGGVEPSGGVSLGDQEQMAGADWKAVPEGHDVRRSDGVSEEDLLVIELAERAEHRG